MQYRLNHNGDRIVDASPEETHALRPAIRACFRRWRAFDADIEDFCQHVELVTWQAIVDGRIRGDGFARPVDALLDFMFAVAWNQWRNHSRKRSVWREVLHDELPDVASPSPDARIEARDVLQRISMRPDVARVLLAAVNGPYPERREGLPKSTFWSRREQALKWARDAVEGAPNMPDPPTPKHRKKKR